METNMMIVKWIGYLPILADVPMRNIIRKKIQILSGQSQEDQSSSKD